MRALVRFVGARARAGEAIGRERPGGRRYRQSPMDLLERVRKELTDRLEELRPQVEEMQRLEEARRALDRPAGAAPARAGTRRSGGRRSRRRTRVSGAERRGQLLAIVRENPDVPVREIADAMSTTPNNVYGLIRRLEQEGALKRSDGRFTVG